MNIFQHLKNSPLTKLFLVHIGVYKKTIALNLVIVFFISFYLLSKPLTGELVLISYYTLFVFLTPYQLTIKQLYMEEKNNLLALYFSLPISPSTIANYRILSPYFFHLFFFLLLAVVKPLFFSQGEPYLFTMVTALMISNATLLFPLFILTLSEFISWQTVLQISRVLPLLFVGIHFIVTLFSGDSLEQFMGPTALITLLAMIFIINGSLTYISRTKFLNRKNY